MLFALRICRRSAGLVARRRAQTPPRCGRRRGRLPRMNRLLLWVRPGVLSVLGALICSAIPVRAQTLHLPREATEGLELLYNGDPGAAVERFRSLQNRQPDHPLGYLLEDDARWWQILCES